MLALFLISVSAFLLLFGAVLLLLRRAKAEGVRAAVAAGVRDRVAEATERRRRGGAAESAGAVAAPALLDESLSRLVPDKQPDWRYMVQERRAKPEVVAAKLPAAIAKRPDWAYYNEDLGDLRDPYQPNRAATERRAG